MENTYTWEEISEFPLVVQNILKDPSVHNWVKPILRKLQDHDPVDALHDCELLVTACKANLKR